MIPGCVSGVRESISTRFFGLHKERSDASVLSVTEDLFGTWKIFGRFIREDFLITIENNSAQHENCY